MFKSPFKVRFLPPIFVVKGKSLMRYPIPRIYSSPLVSVNKLLSKLSDNARSVLSSAKNLNEFFNSKSTLTSGLNCSTKLIFPYSFSGKNYRQYLLNLVIVGS